MRLLVAILVGHNPVTFVKHIAVLCVLIMSAFVTSSHAAGNEARCTELGANCICSEPMNTATYVAMDTYAFNPADTTTKECTKASPSYVGSVIEDSTFRYVAITSGEALTNLPAAHTNTYVLRTKTSAEGNAAGGGGPVTSGYLLRLRP